MAYLGRALVVSERDVHPEEPHVVVPFVRFDDVGVDLVAGVGLRQEHRLDGEAVEAGDALTSFLRTLEIEILFRIKVNANEVGQHAAQKFAFFWQVQCWFSSLAP